MDAKYMKIAVEALEMRRKKFAVGNSTYLKYPDGACPFSFAIRDREHYLVLTEAIEYFGGELARRPAPTTERMKRWI